MSDIASPETFTDSGAGATVNAARLMNHVNGALNLPGLISDKAIVTPVAGDYLLIYQSSTVALKRASAANVAGLGPGISSIALSTPAEFSVSGSPLTGNGTITLSWASQSGNKVIASPADGTSGPLTARALVPRDYRLPPVSVTGTVVDWSLGDIFYTTLSSSPTFTFSNVTDGTIILKVIQDATGGRALTLPAIGWSGNAVPVSPKTANHYDIYTFVSVLGVITGSVVLNCT